MTTPIEIYTDGACRGNPGPGGWAALLYYSSSHDPEVEELGSGVPYTTNNQMELQAAIAALRHLGSPPSGTPLIVWTDSTYLIQGVTKWSARWILNSWRTQQNTLVINAERWQELLALCRGLCLEWRHVRAHRGHPENTRVDALAVEFALGRSPALYRGSRSQYPLHAAASSLPPSVPKQSAFRGSPGKSGHYISLINGVLARHAGWEDCRARVHGVPRARFQKIQDPAQEAQVLARWYGACAPVPRPSTSPEKTPLAPSKEDRHDPV